MNTPSPAQVAKAFLTPTRGPKDSSSDLLHDAKRHTLAFEGLSLRYWRAGSGPLVVLQHGWEGSSNDMAALAKAFVEKGHSVAALDLPAHGESDGTRADLFQFVRAFKAFAAELETPVAIVAHSVGCPVVIEAIRAGVTTRSAVAIGTPARYKDQALLVAHQVGLSRDDMKEMLEELKALGVDVAAINTPEAVRGLKVPALIIHSDDDKVIPFALGREVADAWPGAKFMPVTGMGHKRILSAPEVVDACLAFVTV